MPSQVPTPMPSSHMRGSVTVTPAADPLVVAESGATTTFTVALSNQPLSEVTVSFSSTNSKLSFSPASVMFHWDAYNIPQTVTVSALDDSIDQGEDHTDTVTATVSSADDLEDCISNCLTSRRFNGVPVSNMPLAATIMDNDVAGILFSSSKVNATFDNFGDSLVAGVYKISLNSKPTAPVVIGLSGLGAYSTFDSSTVANGLVTIQPDMWQDGVEVSVLATAPTTSRPVCSSGGRYCATLGTASNPYTRLETVQNKLSNTADPYYAVFGNGTGVQVSVRTSVAFDVSEPPAVQQALFTDLLNEVSITFDMDTGRGGLSGQFACSEVFTSTASSLTTLFGTGGFCSWADDNLLVITFGSEPTVVPGATLTIKNLLIQAISGLSVIPPPSLFSQGVTITIGQPATPTFPEVLLSASSTSVGICSDLSLDGSGSSGSGGRTMDFDWSVRPVSPTAVGHVENITEAMAVANALNSNKGSYSLTLDRVAMVKGSKFEVNLKAKNFLGYSSNTTLEIDKLSFPAPIVSIQGSNPLKATHSSAITLTASASLPVMTCVDSSLANNQMSYTWTEATGQYTGALTGTSPSPRLLNIPAGALAANTIYQFKVNASMTSSPDVNNAAYVTIKVGTQALVAKISGGAYRQVGYSSNIVLSAANSEDPDESSTPFTYAWTCTTSAGASCGTWSPQVLTIGAGALSEGVYTFGLTVSKGSRSSSTSATVEVLPGSPPVVSIGNLAAAKYSTNGGVLTISSSVQASNVGYKATWTATNSDIAEPFYVSSLTTTQDFASTVTKSYAAGVVGAPAMKLELSAMTPGNTYTFKLTATDANAQASYSTVSVVMNAAPSSGTVSVSPLEGTTPTTNFDLTALNWVDPDLPFTYLFGTVKVNSDLTLDMAQMAAFGGALAGSQFTGVKLAAGANSTQYLVTSLPLRAQPQDLRPLAP